jgi:hypothetical protein
MLEQIKLLPLNDKKTLLAMLQSDIGLTIEVNFTVKKPEYWQVETARCNQVAIVKRSGGQVIYTELQSNE